MTFSECRFWRLIVTSCADNTESQGARASQQLHLRCLKSDAATCCRFWLGFHVWPTRTVRHFNVICIRIRCFRIVSWQHMFSIVQDQYGAHWISSRVNQFASISQAHPVQSRRHRARVRTALFVHLTSNADSACVQILFFGCQPHLSCRPRFVTCRTVFDLSLMPLLPVFVQEVGNCYYWLDVRDCCFSLLAFAHINTGEVACVA